MQQLENKTLSCIATLKELMEETKEVVEVEMLTAYLGIKMEVIRKIQAECPSNIDKAKLRLFSYWLENDLNASWKKLTAALEDLDKRVLATKISDKIRGEWMVLIFYLRKSQCIVFLFYSIVEFSLSPVSSKELPAIKQGSAESNDSSATS